jgi:hypothetical protein
LQGLVDCLENCLKQAQRDSNAAGDGRHYAVWQHAFAADSGGGPEAEEPWLDPSALPAPPSLAARGLGSGGHGGSGGMERRDGGIEEDPEAAEKLLRRLGGDPRAGRIVSCGRMSEVDGSEVVEDRAMLLQIEAEKELRARIAEKNARKEAAAAAAVGGDAGSAGDDSDGSQDDSSDSFNCTGSSSGGSSRPDGGGVRGQSIKTYPVEDSNRVPSNRIYHSEDGLQPDGGDTNGVCLPKPPAPRLFSSLDEDGDGDGAGEGAGRHQKDAPRTGGDGGSEAQAAGCGPQARSCGPQPTQAGQDGLEWVLEEELANARSKLPLVRWAEAGGRTDERALAEIGRSYRAPSPPST